MYLNTKVLHGLIFFCNLKCFIAHNVKINIETQKSEQAQTSVSQYNISFTECALSISKITTRNLTVQNFLLIPWHNDFAYVLIL